MRSWFCSLIPSSTPLHGAGIIGNCGSQCYTHHLLAKTVFLSSVLYTQVPVVDLSASDDEAAAVLAYGCQVFGFFYSKNTQTVF